MPRPIDINAYLSALEYEYNIAILGAWDTGSRAWGLHSDESDYDIKLAYARPHSQYSTGGSTHSIDTNGTNLSEISDRTSIDPELIEIAGWDAPYFMELISDSNPAPMEALHSPLAYNEHPLFEEIRSYTAERFNIIDLGRHYRSLAKSNYLKYITGNRPEDRTTKRTLNIIRGLMYAEYIFEMHEIPEFDFPRFIESAPEPITDGWDMDLIRDHIDDKRAGNGGERIGNPHADTIEAKIEQLSMDNLNPKDHIRDEYMSTQTLNQWIQSIIQPRLLTQ